MDGNPKVFEQFFDRLRKRRLVKRTLSVLKWLLFTLIAIVLFSYIALQFPAVQNYLVQKVTNYLSNELDTDVSIKRIDIEFFDKLVLEEFYLEDQSGDTLLYSKELKADFKTNLIQIFSKRLDVDNLYLTNARVNIKRDSAALYNNLHFLQEYFKGNKKPKEKKNSASNPFLLDVNGLYLNDVHFVQDDKVSGQYISIYVPSGEILIDNVDLANNEIAADEVLLRKPHVIVEERQKFPAPKPKATLIKVKDTLSSIVSVDSTNQEKLFKATVDHFKMIEGTFDYDQLRKSPVRTKPEDILDFKHLDVLDINIDIEDFRFEDDVFYGKVNNIALAEKSGFILNELSANEASISDEFLMLNGMKLITPYSNLGDTLTMQYDTYRDFRNFEEAVKMVGKFNNAEIALRDIIVFAPNLAKNKFFKQNENEVVKIDGLVRGSVNKLRGKNLTLHITGNTLIKGNFNTRDLSIRGEEFLSLKLDRLRTNFETLRLLVPGFNAPQNFDKLGTLDFNGRFDGFFNDFVAKGELKTDLGIATMDMGLNLKKGRALAEYHGSLELKDFDLKRWSDNENFGKISFVSEVEEGVGLTLETVNTRVTGKVQSFTFKDYTYNDLVLDGLLSQNLFDGQLESKDENVDFVFNGKIDFETSVPTFDFDASINRFDLKALNLSKQPLTLAGDVALDFENFKLSDIKGNGAFYDFKIIDERDTFLIDTLLIDSKLDTNKYRTLEVISGVLNVNINGVYDIQELPVLFGQYLVKNFPEFSDRFGIRAKDKSVKDSRFDFKVVIPDSKNFTHLIDPKLDTLRYAYAEGRMDNVLDSIKLRTEIPSLKYGNLRFDDVLLTYEGYKDESVVLLDLYHTSINENQHFEPLQLKGDLERDTFFFDINSTNFTSIFDDLNLRGKFFLYSDFFQVQFLPSNLVILKDQWNIEADNFIRFKKGQVITNNFDLQNFEKRIVVESIEGSGLTMSLENFDLALIDDWWVYDKLDFGGKFFVLLEAGDVFKLEDMYATAIADSLKINGDYYGELRLDVAMRSLKEQVDAFISIQDEGKFLIGEGIVAPFNKQARGNNYTNDFDFNFELRNYPLDIVEYFIPNGISNTQGAVNSDVRLYGLAKQPKIFGEMFISDLGVTIDYLQTRYTAPTGRIKIDNEFLFDASENVIYDSLGNTAKITGGIRHTALKKLILDVSMSSDEFLFLDTDKSDNELYYGYGIGKGDVKFSGSFNKTDIDIVAVTGKGSILNIPISYDQDASEVSFIKFVEKDSIGGENEELVGNDLKGVEVKMDLRVTDEASVYLIFDERAGDIVEGKGTGNIEFDVLRNGDISMYGDYEIEEGEYLFTLFNAVNKKFSVKKGGTIVWDDGDPFNAKINLEATYEDLKTPVYNFILEYLNSDIAKNDAKATTEVVLTMLLSGPMLQPEINFDIEFPNLTGELKNYTDSKLRLVRQDQNELNRQVFGLLVIGGFLPNQADALAGTQGLIGINTVSELLSNQLSIYLTEILSEVFTDVGFVSGVDFKVNYNVFQADGELDPGEELFLGTEIGVVTKLDLFNDRLSVNVGGSYVDQGGRFISGDLVVEYFITKNRRLKARFYRLSDQTIQGRRDKLGIGISVRREFDSFSEFIKGMRKTAKSYRDDSF